MSEYYLLKTFKKTILCGFLLSNNYIFFFHQTTLYDVASLQGYPDEIQYYVFLYLSSFSLTCSDTPIKTMQIKEMIRTRVFVHLFAPKAFCSDAYSEHRRATSKTSDPLSHHPTQRLTDLQCIPPHVNRVSMTHMSGAIRFSGRLENQFFCVSISQTELV